MVSGAEICPFFSISNQYFNKTYIKCGTALFVLSFNDNKYDNKAKIKENVFLKLDFIEILFRFQPQLTTLTLKLWFVGC